MEYTIEFYKSSVNAGRTIIHQTTMCQDDETKLKREVTKLAKTIEPFDKLQKECPISWDNYGYHNASSFGKRWTPYTKNFPFNEKWTDDDYTYSISISQTSNKFKTAQEKLSKSRFNLKKAYEDITNTSYAFNPDISVIDPEIANIINADLPRHYETLIELVDAADKRLQKKVDELNNKTE